MFKRLFLVAVVAAISTSVARTQQVRPTEVTGFGLKKQTFHIRLLSPVNTASARKGDKFTAIVDDPAQWQGGIIVAHITKVERSHRGIGRGKAQVMFVFDTLTYGGRTAPIAGVLVGVSNSKGVKNVDDEGRVIGRSSTKKRVAAGLGGALLGATLGELGGGGGGAAMGAIAGFGAGFLVAATLTTNGPDIEFHPGSQFTVEISDTRNDQQLQRGNQGPSTGNVGPNTAGTQEKAPSGDIPVSCQTASMLRSPASPFHIEVRFVNQSSGVRRFYWVAYNGRRILYQTLPPGRYYMQSTYANQIWLVTDVFGRCVEAMQLRAGQSFVSITQ